MRTFSLATMLRLVRIVLSFVLTCALARFLGGEGFGEIAVAMAVVSVLLSVGELGFARYTVRELMKHEETQPAVLGVTITARFMVSAVLFCGLSTWVGWHKPEGALLLMVYGLQLLTNPLTEVLAWLEAHGHVAQSVKAQFSGFLLSAVCIACGIWGHAPLWFFALTYALEGWVFIGLCVMIFRRSGGRIQWRAFEVKRACSLMSRAWPELAAQAALMLLFRLDTLMIEWLRGAAEAGVYGAAVRVSETAYFMPGILATLFLPRLMQARKSGGEAFEKSVVDYFSSSVVMACVVTAGLLVVSPLLPHAFGREFVRSAEMLRVHAWAFVPYAIGIARTQVLTVEDKLAANLPSVMVAVGVNAWLNWLWIPEHGGLGAAWATLVAYSVAWVAWTYLSPWLRLNVSGLLTRSLMGLPRFTLLRMRSFLHS